MDSLNQQRQRESLEILVARGGDGATSVELAAELRIDRLQAAAAAWTLTTRGLAEYRRTEGRALVQRDRYVVYVATLAGVDTVQRG